MKVDIVHFDDWIVIYKDGKAIFQNHSIRPQKLLNLLNIEHTSHRIDDWDYCKSIPENYEEYNFE